MSALCGAQDSIPQLDSGGGILTAAAVPVSRRSTISSGLAAAQKGGDIARAAGDRDNLNGQAVRAIYDKVVADRLEQEGPVINQIFAPVSNTGHAGELIEGFEE